MTEKKKKKLRIAIVTIIVIACIIGVYFLAFRRPQPMMDCLPDSQPAVTGTITRHNYEGDTETVTLEDPQEVATVWDNMERTSVRFVQGRMIATIPEGGTYYEVNLSSGDGKETTCAYGLSSDGRVLIQGSAYQIVGESNLLSALEGLF